MDERSGMDIARRVRELHLDTVIIFVTNYPEFSMEGYEVRAYACLYLIDRLQSSTIAAVITLFIVSVTLILTLAPCNNSAIHCSNEELQDMKIAVRKRLVLYCLIVPPLLLLKPLYSTVWIVAAAADALLLVLAKIGVGIK